MVAPIANQQWLSMNMGFYKFVFIRSGAMCGIAQRLVPMSATTIISRTIDINFHSSNGLRSIKGGRVRFKNSCRGCRKS